MTDAHCHLSCGEPTVRELIVGRDFVGVHPWDAAGYAQPAERESLCERLVAELEANPSLGVGEIGLDRLRAREIAPEMRALFTVQLELAARYHRPVVLHGAKCWGQVVSSVRAFASAGEVPACLFHGFSRSDGLIPEIVALNGYISVGPSVLNDHAVNYRELVKKIPADRLLVETDRTADSPPVSVRDVLRKTAEIRGVSFDELERQTDTNAFRFKQTY